MKQLVEGNKKYVDTVRANSDMFLLSDAYSTCLTAEPVNDWFASATQAAPATTGILVSENDSVLVNWVRVIGHIKNKGVVGHTAPLAARILIVSFQRPALAPGSTGTLPPVTEVLTTANYDSLPLLPNDKAGRFSIISDKKFQLGFVETSNGVTHGPLIKHIDERIRINKKVEFGSPADTSVGNAGHFDGDSPKGSVTSGLLMMYIMLEGGSGSTLGGADVSFNTRLCYTG